MALRTLGTAVSTTIAVVPTGGITWNGGNGTFIVAGTVDVTNKLTVSLIATFDGGTTWDIVEDNQGVALTLTDTTGIVNFTLNAGGIDSGCRVAAVTTASTGSPSAGIYISDNKTA